MNPKKASKLYRQVAEDTNVEENLVEHLVEFYYKEIRQQLSGLTHPYIRVNGLGHFYAKKIIIRKAIPRFQKILETHDTSTFGAYFNKKSMESKLEKLINIEGLICQEELRKKTFKEKKNESSAKSNLGEQDTDS